MKYTKKQQEIIRSYERSNAEFLREVYTSYSNEKRDAYFAIQNEMRGLRGRQLRITGHNTSFFSCAYQYERDGQRYLRYHTKSNVIDIPYGRKE